MGLGIYKNPIHFLNIFCNNTLVTSLHFRNQLVTMVLFFVVDSSSVLCVPEDFIESSTRKLNTYREAGR